MITVLMTVYNSEKFIAQAISSVLVQSYNNYELLIIDDGSNDSTCVIVNSFSDKRIKLILRPREGRSAALNYGLKTARYEWVTLLDADDLMAPGKLTQLSKNIYYKNSIVTTWMGVFNGCRLLYLAKYPSENELLRKFLLVHAFNNSVMYYRNFIIENGGYSKNGPAEDYDLWLRLIDKANFVCIPEYLSYHRYTSNSYSIKNFNLTRKQIRKIQQRYSELLEKMEMEASERENILLRREYFFGESILSCKQEVYSLKYALLFLISILPEKIANRIRVMNIKARLEYLLSYFSKENIILRIGLKRILGNGNKIYTYRVRGLFY